MWIDFCSRFVYFQDDDSTALKPFLEQPLCAYTGHSADVLDLSWSKVNIV